MEINLKTFSSWKRIQYDKISYISELQTDLLCAFDDAVTSGLTVLSSEEKAAIKICGTVMERYKDTLRNKIKGVKSKVDAIEKARKKKARKKKARK